MLIDLVPTLGLPAFFITCVGRGAVTRDQVWAWLIDAVHRRSTQPDLILERLDQVGPVMGRAELRRRCQELARLRVESIFQDDVAQELARLGYRPERSTMRIATPDGVGVQVDIPLLAWKVAVEPDGDAYHRTREQRRADRRRDAAFAGTDWVRVPIDWRDWHLERGYVLAAIDAAIAAQQRRGIGTTCPAPQPAPLCDPARPQAGAQRGDGC
ncbi:MAG: hypothetical protein LC679_08420 [Intrasporangiaceae bacterium]|nr:hypothetical protein [Intrasporangiaceae bacterium]